ncbi:MAG: hypothetical protein WGN25_17835 [Candidatus Electrothrix sp. GW3-4]|uniref:hypothetical protein n=1 Tax=Candidatus Electrothrix sp. GW3-4 TaxID=3126740 RepID=UPI0030D2D8E6
MKTMQQKTEQRMERALEKAAKMICTLKCGLCPIREENFSGCPWQCTEETRPWQCWVAHLQEPTR